MASPRCPSAGTFLPIAVRCRGGFQSVSLRGNSVLAAIRHTLLISAVERLARTTFADIFPFGDNWIDQLAALRREFQVLIRLESRRYETLKADLSNWRDRVSCGDVEFDPEREDDFKGGLLASIALASFLIETFDAYSNKGSGNFLTNPRFIRLVQSHRQAAQNILASWKSPEWETTDERTVKWDKEQTEYLRQKLASWM
jgi:hypothetical protein